GGEARRNVHQDLTIFEGASEIQRWIIGGAVTGLQIRWGLLLFGEVVVELADSVQHHVLGLAGDVRGVEDVAGPFEGASRVLVALFTQTLQTAGGEVQQSRRTVEQAGSVEGL